VQKTVSALEAEIRHLALPLGAMTAPVADGVEDYAPMTPRIVEKTRDIVPPSQPGRRHRTRGRRPSDRPFATRPGVAR